jgi:hypothetical protein
MMSDLAERSTMLMPGQQKDSGGGSGGSTADQLAGAFPCLLATGRRPGEYVESG